VPKLFAVNGWKTEDLPKFVPGEIDPPDLGQLGQFMNSMSAAGVNWFPDDELEKFIRNAARLPEMGAEAEKVKEDMTRQNLIVQAAQQRLQAINVRAQAEQGMQNIQQAQQAQQPQEQAAQPEAQPQQGGQQAQPQAQTQEEQK
jgi:hypothetical protein